MGWKQHNYFRFFRAKDMMGREQKEQTAGCLLALLDHDDD